ncbi:MAG: hypothetical protein OXC95_18215, partial [Dehalococcoidia bacterium]|nr:hypothetical protein [Dehalococcoidia bacterium]
MAPRTRSLSILATSGMDLSRYTIVGGTVWRFFFGYDIGIEIMRSSWVSCHRQVTRRQHDNGTVVTLRRVPPPSLLYRRCVARLCPQEVVE